MRPLWKDVLAAVWLGMIIPGIVLNAFVLKEQYNHVPAVFAQPVETATKKNHVIYLREDSGKQREIDLESYLTGVLLAEMPAAFHEEALKAQSVAARTYTWKAHTTGGKHGNGSMCTDSACCQAYLTEMDYLACGGTEEALEKVRQAVAATSGFILVYEDEPIEATYFSSAGGSTEAALAVWGADFPYLQAVSSPEKVLIDVVVYSLSEFENKLGRDLPENATQWFDAVEYTEGGGVESLEICGESYSGVELRSLLGLRSTAFEVFTEDQTITIITRGYGHRVGMSQYGADAMANSGSNYQKILQHYYPGTNLVPIP